MVDGQPYDGWAPELQALIETHDLADIAKRARQAGYPRLAAAAEARMLTEQGYDLAAIVRAQAPVPPRGFLARLRERFRLDDAPPTVF